MVVDSFAESRQHDVLHLAEELEHEDINEKRPAKRNCALEMPGADVWMPCNILQHLFGKCFIPNRYR